MLAIERVVFGRQLSSLSDNCLVCARVLLEPAGMTENVKFVIGPLIRVHGYVNPTHRCYV